MKKKIQTKDYGLFTIFSVVFLVGYTILTP